MYQAVFLDAGNTLFHTPVSRRDRIAQALERRGRPADLERIEAIMERVRCEMWDSPLWPLKTREREERWWLEYFERLLDHLSEDIDLAGDLAQETLYVHHVQAFDDVREVLEALRPQVRLGVISNAYPSLSEALDALALSPYLDAVINSSLVDAWKPDLRIYQIALEQLKVRPEEAIFVDDMEENVAAAEDLGLTALLIDRWAQYTDSTFQRIEDLRPLLKLVENPR